MKFSHSIQLNAVPEWSAHYLPYSSLKKLIFSLEKAAYPGAALRDSQEVEAHPFLDGDADAEETFCRALDAELNKIDAFYLTKEKEIFRETQIILDDVHSYLTDGPGSFHHPDLERSVDSLHSNDDYMDDSDDNTDSRPGTSRRRAASMSQEIFRGNSSRISNALTNDLGSSSFLYSPAIMLKKRITHLYVHLCELKSFIQLNKTGFRKVLKKFDKIMLKNLRDSYMPTVLIAHPFCDETMEKVDGYIQGLEKAYASIVTSGDEELARKDLRAHLREHVVWERNTVWRDMIGLERRVEAARLGKTLLGSDVEAAQLLGDEIVPTGVMTSVLTPMGRIHYPKWLTSPTILTIAGIFSLFLFLLLVPFMEKPEQQNCLAMLVFISLLWATEAIPLFVTSLLIPFLCVVLRVILDDDGSRLAAKETTVFVFSSMWSPVIMLLLGGFTLAAALSKCTIDKRLATFVLSKAGTEPRIVILANMFVAAFSSMLISNVAAPVLCFSIIEPMLRTLPSQSSMSKALILGIALASNIGGMLSPIASPQNIVAIGVMQPAPTWIQWFFVAIPVGVVSIFLIWILLLITFQPGAAVINPVRPLREKFTGIQWFVTIITLSTIGLWCASHSLEAVFGDMGVIAIMPMVLFFGIGILTKEDFNNFPWTIIILAAGGLSLGKAVKSSGLLDTIAALVTREIAGFGLYGIVLIISFLTLVIATFISHTVAAMIMLPLVFNVGRDLEQPAPNLLVMGAVLLCSAAMGLPTSGFPNMTAIMKEDQTGQRYLTVKHFISRGVTSSFLTLGVVVTLGYIVMLLAKLD